MVFKSCVRLESFQSLKGVQCLVIHVQNYCGWASGRGLLGDILLRSSSFDPVTLRHEGVADFGVKENICHTNQHGFLCCLVCLVHLVCLVSLVSLVERDQYGSPRGPS